MKYRIAAAALFAASADRSQAEGFLLAFSFGSILRALVTGDFTALPG
ncbi:hypothetical protein [Emergencia sp.]